MGSIQSIEFLVYEIFSFVRLNFRKTKLSGLSVQLNTIILIF